MSLQANAPVSGGLSTSSDLYQTMFGFDSVAPCDERSTGTSQCRGLMKIAPVGQEVILDFLASKVLGLAEELMRAS